MTVPLDANALIAVTVTDHVHHDLLENWFTQRSEPFSTCPLTQRALLRFTTQRPAPTISVPGRVSG